MKNKPKYLLLILAVPLLAGAQQVSNPSFEGETGVAITPKGWSAYGIGSSPDTQPGAWNVNTPSSDGNTYISLVCRGITGINNNLWELCSTSLISPLKEGVSYHYSIDLAYSQSFYSGGISFNKPVNLRIWGLNRAAAEEELLWQSGPVTGTRWRKYNMILTPKKQVDDLVLEAWYVSLPKYNGNILIDKFVYLPDKEPLQQDTTDAYNFVYEEHHIPETINNRTVGVQKEMHFNDPFLTLKVWDNRTFDGDTISLFINDECILDHYLLTKEKKIIKISLNPTSANYLTLYAHNLGRIPPNTAAMIIVENGKEKYVSLKSDLNNCGALKMILRDVVDDGTVDR